LSSKRRAGLITLIFGPTIVVFALIQNIVLLDVAAASVIGIIFLGTCVYWYIVGSARYFIANIQLKRPPIKLDQAFFVALLMIVFFSLFNIFLTFAWVALGLLLNPERVMAFFVGFLTVFAVAVFKVQSLAQLMKEAENHLHMELFKQFMGKEKLTEEDYEKVESVKLSGRKLVEYFEAKGLTPDEAKIIASRIESFRRFRVRFLIGNLVGSLLVLTALIVFILLGVEAFRLKSAVVSSVGSTLEGVAGAGSVINEKMGDRQGDVDNLVSRFSTGRAFKGLSQ